MSFIWEKSASWRWIVASGRASRGFMVAFAGVCLVVPWVVGQAVMSATNSNNEQLQTELRKSGRDRDSLVMGRVNKERLQEYLGEIQRKDNTEDRYMAALRGETLTGTPGARIRGGGSSILRPEEVPHSPKFPEKTPELVVASGANQGTSTAASS